MNEALCGIVDEIVDDYLNYGNQSSATMLKFFRHQINPSVEMLGPVPVIAWTSWTQSAHARRLLRL